jgi:hypothetical protein
MSSNNANKKNNFETLIFCTTSNTADNGKLFKFDSTPRGSATH